MATATSSQLQQLAGHRSPEQTAISLYLDFDPSVAGTAPDLAAHIRSGFDQLRAEQPQRGGAAEQRFREGFEQVEAFLAMDDPRGGRHVHGAVIFADGADSFAAFPLTRSAGDAVSVGARFALRRLAVRLSRTGSVLLLIAGRELGRLVLLREGELRELVDADEDVENRHHQGGWAQSKLQRYTDRQAELHLGHVVDVLTRVHRRLGRPPLVVAATDPAAAVVRDQLGQEQMASLIGELPNVRDLDQQSLMGELQRLADEHDRGREAALLERRAAQIGRGEVGDEPADALAAISDARVETLLLAPAVDLDVFACPDCGRLSDRAQVCPVDGSFMQPDGGVEAAVSATLAQGGTVWELSDGNRDALTRTQGLGVVLRF